MILLDSNVVIDVVRHADGQKQEEIIDDGFSFSTITEIEVLGYHRVQTDEEHALRVFLSWGDEIVLDETVKHRAISLRQAKKMGLADSIIAATALIHGLTLATRNTDDFKNIPGLTIFDPFAKP